MKGKFLQVSTKARAHYNIYANKSSVVLKWLLYEGIAKKDFSLREVVRETQISLGLVQRTFEALTLNGCLKLTGVRTAKKFSIKKPEKLLELWLTHYNILMKCKLRSYSTGFAERKQLLQALKNSGLQQHVVLALHSAAEAHGCKNTNLQTLELYVMKPGIRDQIEKALQLHPQERSYEVLLIEPYYKSLLAQTSKTEQTELLCTSPLLTLLDLYHFPLRGQEQAEFMVERTPELKRIYKGGPYERGARNRRSSHL